MLLVSYIQQYFRYFHHSSDKSGLKVADCTVQMLNTGAFTVQVSSNHCMVLWFIAQGMQISIVKVPVYNAIVGVSSYMHDACIHISLHLYVLKVKNHHALAQLVLLFPHRWYGKRQACV